MMELNTAMTKEKKYEKSEEPEETDTNRNMQCEQEELKKKKRQERWVKIRALVLGEQGNRRLDGLFDTKSMLASLLLSDADGDGDVDMSDLEAKGPFGNGPGKFFGPIGLFTLPFHLTRIFIGWAHKESKDIIAANKKKAEEK